MGGNKVTPREIGFSRIAEIIPASFSTFYLTLIAMIQGVALGLLSKKFEETFNSFTFMVYPARLGIMREQRKIHPLRGRCGGSVHIGEIDQSRAVLRLF